MVLRNCFGMIMSVSTFCRSSGAAVPLSIVKVGMPPAAPLPPLDDTDTGSSRVTAEYSPFGSVSPSGSMVLSSAAPSAKVRMSVSVPCTAAAAAMAGDTRCVRPPPPCRPSKLRLEVEAQRSPGLSLSGFIARHMLHPGSRQSNPASMKILSRPSRIACSLTRPDPGTTMAYTWSATLRPLATAAAARISSIRALVQDPMNTLSILTWSSFSFGDRPM
mmetsp:Transcript_7737/g.15561  ORF Transcript_7737/g.15561 Transcript_7737/m.15561 type:complete len:218 (+) Transcript_7737:649-1302(+)